MRLINRTFIADTARVLGEVTLGWDTSIWYGAVLRGDVAAITLGEGCNVQDNAVLHCDFGKPLTIGNRVTIGHGAVVHGVEVGDGCLIGIHATVLGGSRLGARCLVAAGAVVTPGLVVPDDSVVMGVPGKVVRPTNDKEREYLAWLAPHYVRLAQRHVSEPESSSIRPF